jgi:hydrogenase maturation protease
MMTDAGGLPGDQAEPYAAGPGRVAPGPCALAVVGCGNPLRADDGVGPLLVRRLREARVPPGVRLVDGGTAGADVAAQMRGAKRVIVVDASSTGAAPGTVYRVPGREVEDMPPLSGLHSHSFRWDHALAFARWLLGDEYPSDVTVYLIEAADRTPGGELSALVRHGMEQVLGLIMREPAFRGSGRLPTRLPMRNSGMPASATTAATR